MKEKIDIIGKEIEIYKVKMFLYTSVAGGSWIYALKFDKLSFIMMLWFVFLISSIGVFSNISKLNELQKELGGIRDD